jgi:hypothetical protein
VKPFKKYIRETSTDYFAKEMQKYTLIIGKSQDIFSHYGVEEMHGLRKEDSYDTPSDAYIAGLSNYSPHGESEKPFLFINETRIGKNPITDALLCMHETMHLSLLLFNWDVENKEEEIITWAEAEAAKIYKLL